MFLTVVGVGCLIGITTVLFGFGGGFVTVPVVFALVVARGETEPMHTAVATSAAVMVVTASAATLAQLRSGRLHRQYLWPLAAFVAVGAAFGAVAAHRVSETVLHVLFVGYLAVTIADSLGRSGFLHRSQHTPARALSRTAVGAGGIGIGAVASFLGVGGSVMTVPLLRRRGLPMAEAIAMANPLSVPVAVVATIVYAVAPAVSQPGRLGHIDLIAVGALLCGSLPTIMLARRWVGSIADHVHAIAYLLLLSAVATAMAVTAFG